MSLMDALLLEGFDDTPASARNVHIALRGPDGPLGSGSLADPYNGSVRFDPPVALDSLDFDSREVVLVGWLAQAHGLSSSTGQVKVWVTDNFTGAIVPAPWSGTFTVHWASSVAFSIILSSPPRPSDQPQWNHLIWFEDASGNTSLARLFWPVASGVTSGNHGYLPYQAIRISGAADPAFNADLVAVGVGTAAPSNPSSFKCLLTRWPTSAAGNSAVSTRLIYGLDEVMRSLPAHSRLHLGPGTFETRGAANGYITAQYNYDELSVGFVVKPAQTIVGSGMAITTVKLVQAVDPYDNTVAIRTFLPKDDVAISDLAVDCNLGGQPCCAGVWVPRVTCGAIWGGGRHLRICRVRAINFGDQALPECFVFYLGGEQAAGAGDNAIEDCIVEKPSESNAHESTSIAISPPDHVSGNNRGSVARHNYLNFEYSNGTASHPIAVKSLLRDANDLKLVRLETYEPHGHIPSKRLVLRGAANPGFNGVFPIAQIVSDTVLTFRMTKDAPAGEGAGGQTYIGFGLSSEDLIGDNAVFETFEASYLTAEYLDPGLISWLDLEAREGDLFIDPGEVLVTVTTRRPHQHVVGQLAQLLIWKDYSAWRPTGWREGSYPIVAVFDTHRLACRWPGPPSLWENTNHVLLGARFHGPNASGTACVTEGNAVYDAQRPCYSDTGSSRDAVLRDNYYSNIGTGVLQDFSGGLSESQKVISLKRDSGDHQIAILETDGAHRLMPGQAVTVDNARVSGQPSVAFNGTFAVDSVLSDHKFTYKMIHPADGDADNTPSPVYRVRWQTRHLLVENNVFEGYATDEDTAWAASGVIVDGYHEPPPYMFAQWLIRDNFMRHLDNAPEFPTDLGGYGLGMRIISMDGAIVDGNVVDFPNPHTLHAWKSEHVVPFNNQTPAGDELRAFQDISANGSGNWVQIGDLETTLRAALDEAMVLSFL